MSVPDETAVSYAYSATDHVKAQATLPVWRMLRVVQVASASVAVGGAIAIMVAGWIAGKLFDASAVALGLLPVGAIWWLVPVGLRALEVHRYRRQTPDGTPQTIRFGPKGFSSSPDGPLIPWGLISQVRETPEAYLISDASSTSWMSIPKRAFSDAQRAEFRSTIEREFLSRPKQLKLSGAK